MEVRVEKKVIPSIAERVEEVEIYTAKDGKEFYGHNAKGLCERHEAKLDAKESIKSIPHKKIETLDGYEVDAYYIKTKEESEAVYNYLACEKSYWSKTWHTFRGEDWYMFYIEEGYNNDSYNTNKLSDTKETIRDFLKQFR